MKTFRPVPNPTLINTLNLKKKRILLKVVIMTKLICMIVLGFNPV